MSLTPSVVDWLGPIWFFYLFFIFLFFITHHSSLNFYHSSLITHHSKIPQFLITLLGGLFGWNISVGFSIQTLTFMSLIGSHKNQLQIRCTERSPSLPALSLSLSLSFSRPFHNKTLFFPNFKNPYTTAASPFFHHRSSALQTLTPPLIFCPSFPRLHCVRSLRYQES